MKNENGFTFIEVFLTVVIIGIVATAGMININGSRERYVADTARAKLINELNNARAEALAQNKSIVLEETGSNKYTIRAIDGEDLEYANIGKEFKLYDKIKNSEGKKIGVEFDGISGGENIIIFDSRGGITNIVGDSATINISFGDITRTITIFSTGYIRED